MSLRGFDNGRKENGGKKSRSRFDRKLNSALPLLEKEKEEGGEEGRKEGMKEGRKEGR